MQAVNVDTKKIDQLDMSDGSLHIKAVPEAAAAARRGELYSWNIDYNAGNNDNAVYIRNTHPTKILKLATITVNPKLKTFFKLALASGLGSGTLITGVNWPPATGGAPQAIVYQNAGDVGTLSELNCLRVQDWSSGEFKIFGVLQLAEGDAAVVVNENTTDLCLTVVGFFK